MSNQLTCTTQFSIVTVEMAYQALDQATCRFCWSIFHFWAVCFWLWWMPTLSGLKFTLYLPSLLQPPYSASAATFGLPKVIVTYNASTFTSAEFQQFPPRNGKHKKSPPYHPATNGLVEHAVQTFKRV